MSKIFPIRVERDGLLGKGLSFVEIVAESCALPISLLNIGVNYLGNKVGRVAINALAAYAMKGFVTKGLNWTGKVGPNSKIHYVATAIITAWFISESSDKIYRKGSTIHPGPALLGF